MTILETLKTSLRKPSSATTPPTLPVPPLTSSALIEMQVQKKQRELAAGKARAAVERLTAPIDEARAKIADLDQQIAEGLADERDVTTLMDQLTQARGRLRALETARELAQQKYEAAQR